MLVDVTIRRIIGSVIVLFGVVLLQIGRASATQSVSPSVSVVSTSPSCFVQNCGQWPDSILFQTKVNGAVVWFSRTGLYYQLFKRNDSGGVSSGQTLTRLVHEDFAGANRNAEVAGEDESGYRCNYFLGNDSTKWTTDVPTFASIRYHDIYPGIDLQYYYRNGRLEYDYLLSPSADPLAIQIEYQGIDSLVKGAAGELMVMSDWGKIIQQPPTVFAATTGLPVACEYRIEGKSFGFSLPSEVRELAIVIDPVLLFSSFLGGSYDEVAYDITTDSHDNIYLAGYTNSTDFPAFNSYDWSSNYSLDGFVTKLSPLGADYIFSTYIGGSSPDNATSVKPDKFDRVLVGGTTHSYDFPAGGPIQPANAGTRDGFVLKLTASGNDLVFSTYFGGFELDSISDVAVDDEGANYACGIAWSYDIPLKNSFSTQNAGGNTAFLVKIAPDGDSIIYSTYLGSAFEQVNIAVDSDRSAILSGQTAGNWFPLKNAIDSSRGEAVGAFVTKFTPRGDSLVFSTYLSGSYASKCTGIAVGSDNKIYVSCAAWIAEEQQHYPLKNPLKAFLSGYKEGALTIFSPDGQEFVFSSLWGGKEYRQDELRDITVEDNGNIVVVGAYAGKGFPLVNPIDTVNDYDNDVTVTKFAPNGTGVIYSTYFGGPGSNGALGVAVDSKGNACFTGVTGVDQLPMMNPLDSTFEGGADYGTDAFVVIIGDQLTDVDDENHSTLPTDFTLHQNYPNPFNGETVIQFDLPRAAVVELSIYNILGERARTLASRLFAAGSHSLSWDGNDDLGQAMASGVYFYRMQFDGQSISRKMLIMK